MPSQARVRRKRIRQKRKKRYRLFLQLNVLRPTVFDMQNPKPLAIGIREKIAETVGVPRYIAGWFCEWWCHRNQYRKAIEADNSYRYHISGNRGCKVQEVAKIQ